MKSIILRTVRTMTLALLCSLTLLTAASAADRYFIQVGAFAQQQYVAEELQKLDKAGITGQQGTTVHGLTSVFFGDFSSRTAASKEAVSMKKAGLLEEYAIIPATELVKPPAHFDQSGKRVDDSRTYLEFLPPSSERATPFGASLPGSVFMPRNQKAVAAAPVASAATTVTVATAAAETPKPAEPTVAVATAGQKAAAAQAAPVIPAPKWWPVWVTP